MKVSGYGFALSVVGPGVPLLLVRWWCGDSPLGVPTAGILSCGGGWCP